MIRMLLGATLVATLALAPRTDAFVYWANSGAGTTIGRADSDGSGANPNFITGQDDPCGVAVNGSHIYWGNTDGASIGRANLDGSNPDPDFIEPVPGACGVAVNATHIYWERNTSIGRANLNGSNVTQGFVTGLDNACHVALDATHVYWADNNADTIGRADTSAPNTNVNESFVNSGPPNAPCGVAVAGGDVYWGNYGGFSTIGRADTSAPNTMVTQSFINGAGRPCALATRAGNLYWANHDTNSIGRAALTNPGGANQSFLSAEDGVSTPCGVAVDGLSRPSCQNAVASTTLSQAVDVSLKCSAGGGARTHSIVSQPEHGTLTNFSAQGGSATYTPDAGFRGVDSFTFRARNPGAASNVATATITVIPNPNQFTIGKAERSKKGTALLPVVVPGAGSLALDGSKIKDDAAEASGAGEVELLVQAKGKARKKLKRKGKAKVGVDVTFAPDGGDPSTQSDDVKLKRKR